MRADSLRPLIEGVPTHLAACGILLDPRRLHAIVGQCRGFLVAKRVFVYSRIFVYSQVYGVLGTRIGADDKAIRMRGAKRYADR